MRSSYVMRPLWLIALLAAFGLASHAAAEQETLEARCAAEIIELHQFLEQWSNAELPESEAVFARFADVLDESFLLVDPDGEILPRSPVVEAIRGAHGRWRDAPGRIRIENVQLRQTTAEGGALVTYEEWHDRRGDTVGRLSSVLLGLDPGAPNGLTWLHLHEVWLPSPRP